MNEMERVAEACIRGIHAGQALKGMPGGELPPEDLRGLDARFLKLIRGDASQVQPLLASSAEPLPSSPARLVEALFRRESPAARPEDARSQAALWQLSLEVERDGDIMQELLAFLKSQNLALCPAQVGLDWSEPQMLKIGDELAPQIHPCPFDVSPRGIALTGMKIKHWGEKYAGLITAASYAEELEKGQLAPLRGVEEGLTHAGAQVEAGPGGIVKEEPGGPALAERDHEGDGHIERVGLFMIGRVGVPHHQLLSALVKRPGLFAQAEEADSRLEHKAGNHALRAESDAHARMAAQKQNSLPVVEVKTGVRPADHRPQAGDPELELLGPLLD